MQTLTPPPKIKWRNLHFKPRDAPRVSLPCCSWFELPCLSPPEKLRARSIPAGSIPCCEERLSLPSSASIFPWIRRRERTRLSEETDALSPFPHAQFCGVWRQGAPGTCSRLCLPWLLCGERCWLCQGGTAGQDKHPQPCPCTRCFAGTQRNWCWFAVIPCGEQQGWHCLIPGPAGPWGKSCFGGQLLLDVMQGAFLLNFLSEVLALARKLPGH